MGVRGRKPKKCIAEGCDFVGRRRHGYCQKHWKRYARHGDPLAGGTGRGVPLQWINDHTNYDGDDCLIWPFHRLANGYPGFQHGRWRGNASRFMCQQAHGNPPTPKHVAAHSCGNGRGGCVNPRHLRWSSAAENEADKIEHGTSNRGARHGHAKLTENDVRRIRDLIGTMSQASIARMFGVDQSTVSNIKTGHQWDWLD